MVLFCWFLQPKLGHSYFVVRGVILGLSQTYSPHLEGVSLFFQSNLLHPFEGVSFVSNSRHLMESVLFESELLSLFEGLSCSLRRCDLRNLCVCPTSQLLIIQPMRLLVDYNKLSEQRWELVERQFGGESGHSVDLMVRDSNVMKDRKGIFSTDSLLLITLKSTTRVNV